MQTKRYDLLMLIGLLLLLSVPAVAQEPVSNEDVDAFDWVEQIQVRSPETPNFTCVLIPFPITDESDLDIAIDSANDNTVCPGFDVIDLGGNTITLTGVLPTITSSLTIQNGTIRRAGSAGSFRLLYVSALNETVNLSRLVLANGDTGFGAAVYHTAGMLNIENSIIRNNTSDYGAIRAFSSNARLAISNSEFLYNNSGLNAGALALADGATAYVVESVFNNNSAADQGGAIHTIFSTNLLMINVALRGNQAFNGGAIYSGGNMDLINVLISGNLAGNDGGGLYVLDDADTLTDLELLNVTIAGNRAADVSGGGGIRMESGDADIDNTIVWNNLSGTSGGFASDNTTVNTSTATIGFNRSVLEGGLPFGATNDGTNYMTDPRFVSPITPSQFNLPRADGNYRIGSSLSPAIDAGNNFDVAGQRTIESIADDLDGKPRIQNVTVDIGAYETSPTLNASADVDENGVVTPADVVYVINRLGTADLSADVNEDGSVTNADVQLVLSALGS